MFMAVRIISIGDGQEVALPLKVFPVKQDAAQYCDDQHRELAVASELMVSGTGQSVKSLLGYIGVQNIKHVVAEVPVGSLIEKPQGLVVPG